MSRVAIVALYLSASALSAQESQLAADFRKEGEALKETCGAFKLKSIPSCAATLFTDHPLHIAAGSIAPQNGFGAGLAFVSHYTPNESWRLSFNADGVASSNGSWRAGGYMTAVYVPRRTIVVLPGGSGTSNLSVREYPVFHVYGQSTTLNKLSYFGIGPDTRDTARTYFGMRQTIAGGDVVWPVWKKLNVSLLGEINSRSVDIRPTTGLPSPSIEKVFTNITAPGLTRQPAFAQFGEGIRFRPAFANGHARLNYLVKFQQFAATGDSTYSFQRLTTDLGHEFPLYRNSRSLLPKDSNGPDDCRASVTGKSCPAVSRDREGSVSFRFLMNQSFVATGHTVPFYFQQTLGGTDINGAATLASFQDYRFRAPNNILVRAAFEHSIYGPLGFAATADAGKVALQRGDLDFTKLRHSYSVGMTLRAGGFPMIFLMFAFGGGEGMHTTVNMNTSLLGGSARPPLN